jgi:hypothetical protein
LAFLTLVATLLVNGSKGSVKGLLLLPVPLLCLAFTNGQVLSTFLASAFDDLSSAFGGLAGSKAVFSFSLTLLGLVCSFGHFLLPMLSIDSRLSSS